MLRSLFGRIQILIYRLQHILWTTLIVVALVAAGGGIVIVKSLIRPPHFLMLFDSGVPGSPEAKAALDFAKEAGFDLVLNYSILNADKPVVDQYLTYAHDIGVGVVVSLKDLLGPTDLDPANVHFHQQYGATTDQQVTTIVQDYYDKYPAVWGYYLSDELPEQHDLNVNYWFNALQNRYQQIKKLGSPKQLLASFARADVTFLLTAKDRTDHLMMDFYPYPPGSSYGSFPDIYDLARDMHTAAGDNSWFALQAFSYHVNEPDMVTRFGFAAPPDESNQGAPRSDRIVQMARQALAGGVHNLAIFSYGYAQAIPGQLDEIRDAVRAIRALPEFK